VPEDERQKTGGEPPGAGSQNETWAKCPVAVVAVVTVPCTFEVRESYPGPEGARRWIARHEGVPPLEVRAATRAGALDGLGRAVKRALERLLNEAARG
jgi:hypothetical protein